MCANDFCGQSINANPRKTLRRASSSFAEVSWHITSGMLLSAAVVAFSIYFPFLLAPYAASKTYHNAFYDYDPDISHFDNSLATYGTDYLLAFGMFCLARSITTRYPLTRVHAWRSRGLVACYLLSVLAGGVAHQFYTTLESRNTLTFRFLWTVCVGTVTLASSFMGAIGSELVRHDLDKGLDFLPLLPEWFWVAFGSFTTSVCIAGGISYQRPACDIFIAGITQFPSTFYMMVIFAFGLPTRPVPKWARIVGFLGFILNAPLLPMYPLLVQYTNLSLAAVNTLLHAWLFVAWGMQGLALRSVGQAIVAAEGPPASAIPMKQSKIE